MPNAIKQLLQRCYAFIDAMRYELPDEHEAQETAEELLGDIKECFKKGEEE